MIAVIALRNSKPQGWIISRSKLGAAMRAELAGQYQLAIEIMASHRGATVAGRYVIVASGD